MKTSRFLTAAFLSVGLLTGLSSFTTVPNHSSATETSKGYIEFKITNDLGSDFGYCINGGHNTISKGATKTFSYQEGQEFKYIDGSNCGTTWFKVNSSMSGKTFKISQIAS